MIALQQGADLIGKWQGQLAAGLSVLGRDVPLTLLETKVRPLSHPRLAGTGAMAQHHQRQHCISRRRAELGRQTGQHLLHLDVTQASGLGLDLRFGEIAEPNRVHGVRFDQAKPRCLAERQHQ
ncbi:hypothetical protein D3C84_1080830 [compost metagenome]